MPVYCDESGGISTGAMTFAGVMIEAEAADALVQRFKAVTGARGEMKGSRISLSERGLFFELLERFGGRAIVAQALRNGFQPQEKNRDLMTYAALLEDVVGAWLPQMGGCAEVVIDDGRYDPATLALVRADIAALLGTCGRARLEDSRRSSGIQIADVISNSAYNLAIASPRADRIQRIVEPFVATGILSVRTMASAWVGK